MKKKIAIAAMAVCLVFGGAIGLKMTTAASSASIAVEAQSQSVKKEECVEVKVTVSSDVNMGTLNSIIKYDDSILEYVPDSADAPAGASGTIHIIDSYETGALSADYVLKFKALEVGNCEVFIDETVIEEFGTANVMEASASSVTVTVETNQSISAETRLSDLLIAPARVEETFAPDVYEYHAKVGVSTEQLMLSALPMADDAVVDVEMPKALVIGENKVTVKVTAMSGDAAEYVIYVTRLDTELPDIEEESEDMPEESESDVSETADIRPETQEVQTESEDVSEEGSAADENMQPDGENEPEDTQYGADVLNDTGDVQTDSEAAGAHITVEEN